jgi:zinc transporter, ZIP family
MASASTRSFQIPRWLSALAPLVVIGVMIGAFLAFDPIGELREVPPVEAIAVERTEFDPGEITLEVRNDGPDPVTVAQVLVNDAYWNFDMEDRELARLEDTSIRIPYPWDEGLPVTISMLTSTGVRIDHDVEAASLTPDADGGTILTYALLGLYIGVVPVAIGLLWFPALRRASKKWIAFFLAFTIGLLAFLLVDTIAEGFEIAGETAASLDGLGLFAIGAIAAVLGLLWFEGWLDRRTRGASSNGLRLAYLIATGIGLHNLGEGLAVGAALAAGEVALGTFLILGFALHNTTEGLAIVAPLGGESHRPSLWHFVGLGAVAGVPTIAGAWIGGFAFSPAASAVAFGIAAGAIAQVIWKIGQGMAKERSLQSGLGALGLGLGLIVMYATGLLTA